MGKQKKCGMLNKKNPNYNFQFPFFYYFCTRKMATARFFDDA